MFKGVKELLTKCQTCEKSLSKNDGYSQAHFDYCSQTCLKKHRGTAEFDKANKDALAMSRDL